MDKKYEIVSSCANVPSPYGKYMRVAVIERDSRWPHKIKMISERARGVKKIIQTWEKLNVGKTERCAYQKALKEARELIEKLEKDDE